MRRGRRRARGTGHLAGTPPLAGGQAATGRAAGGVYRDLVSAIAYLPMLALACVGLIMSARTRWRRLLPIYAFMAVFIAPFAVFLPTMRYRLPLDFLLILFASVPLAHLWGAWLLRRSPHPQLVKV